MEHWVDPDDFIMRKKSKVFKAFTIQLKNSEPVTEEKLKKMLGKKSVFGTKIIPGDILLFAMFVEKDNSSPKDVSVVNIRVVKLTLRDMSRMEREYKYIDTPRPGWPRFTKLDSPTDVLHAE